MAWVVFNEEKSLAFFKVCRGRRMQLTGVPTLLESVVKANAYTFNKPDMNIPNDPVYVSYADMGTSVVTC